MMGGEAQMAGDDDTFDRDVRRVLGEPEADDLIDAAAGMNGTPRQLALARVRAMAAYLLEIEDELSHPPARALPDDEPLYRHSEVGRLWERFYEIYCPGPEPPSIVEFLELVEDVAGQIAEHERQLAQVQQEMRDGVIAPSPLSTLAESLGWALRNKLAYYLRCKIAYHPELKKPTMSDAELGAVVLSWPLQRGSRADKGKNKWEAAFRLVRESGFDVHSPQALRMTWIRREFRRLSDDAAAEFQQQILRNIQNMERDES